MRLTYDEHTLKGALEQVERLIGRMPEEVYCDKGYRGAEKTLDSESHSIV